ncbi:MAG TPA: hypothetical protein VHL11_23050 [Phototrophicaceae bacterium]|jgi:hypothetical protein|nr:hypothetical protein [Phototrophicaceae bacterium]
MENQANKPMAPVPFRQSLIANLLSHIIGLTPWQDRAQLARVLDFERMRWDYEAMRTAARDHWQIGERFGWAGDHPPTAVDVIRLIDAYEMELKRKDA